MSTLVQLKEVNFHVSFVVSTKSCLHSFNVEVCNINQSVGDLMAADSRLKLKLDRLIDLACVERAVLVLGGMILPFRHIACVAY